MKKTVAVLQPGYFPWLGFFDQMAQSDAFILYDDVQFDKNGWRNRNRIRTAQGWQWLTIPVLTKNKPLQAIHEVRINNDAPWQRKHLEAIRQNYNKAFFFNEYFPIFSEILSRQWDFLLDLNLEIIEKIRLILNIETPIFLSSNLGIKAEKNERLLKFCHHFSANEYLSGDKAKDYLDLTLFQDAGISVRWQAYEHPIYTQQYSPFVPYLSILDLLFNHGPDSKLILRGKGIYEGKPLGDPDVSRKQVYC